MKNRKFPRISQPMVILFQWIDSAPLPVAFGHFRKRIACFMTMAGVLMVVSICDATKADPLPGFHPPTILNNHQTYDNSNQLLLADAENPNDEFDWEDDDFYSDEDETSAPQLADPLASWNKAMHQFNDRLYFWVLKPVARGYKSVVPTPVRSSVSNFFHNVAAPIRFISCLLQGKGRAAGGELAGFMANSTIGILGIFNVTESYPELNPKEEDLGQVLGVWGIGNGCYVVWPFLGPSTLRDTVGRVGDRFLNPTSYVSPYIASVGITGFEMINTTSFRIGDYEALKDAALIPYEAFRDAYIQLRKKAVSE